MQRRNFWNRFAQELDLNGEAMPGEALIELFGDQRVLIENHCGVLEYCEDVIRVKVKSGQICVSGCGMNLALMSHERLIICGRIDSVHLISRRERGRGHDV